MSTKFNQKFIYLVMFIIILIITAIILHQLLNNSDQYVVGGIVQEVDDKDKLAWSVVASTYQDSSERYHRPSKKVALNDQYSFETFINDEVNISSSEDVIFAYYNILKDASNMIGYNGGCGTIGDDKAPYPYAYNLFTKKVKAKMSLAQFESSFKGVGHISFLTLQPLPLPSNTPDDIKYYLVEMEIITGTTNDSKRNIGGEFAYYYGIVTVKKENNQYLIDGINYLTQDFLCAPYHHWFYDSQEVIQIIYIDNLNILKKVTKTQEKKGLIYIDALGNDNKMYQFVFARLTNGYDILIDERVKENGKMKSVSLLDNKWKGYKFTIDTFKKDNH